MSDIAWDTTRRILQENYEEHAPSNCDSHEGLVAWRAMVAVYRANRLAAENARLTARLAELRKMIVDSANVCTLKGCEHCKWLGFNLGRYESLNRAETPQDGAREAVSE